MASSASTIELPPTLPVIVLGECTLFPHCLLPLYIFEARYRAMVQHALERDRMFCIGTTRSGESGSNVGPGQTASEADAAIHDISTAGLIRACVGQPDGTSHLILQGLQRIRLTGWQQRSPFRIATIEPISDEIPEMPSPGPSDDPEILAADLLDLVARDGPLSSTLAEQLLEMQNPSATADVIAYNLVRHPRLKQEILEIPHLVTRLRLLLAYCSERLSESGEE